MKKIEFIKIINEEISDFDFLGKDEQAKEDEIINLLRNEDFQKQFICDSLINREKVKIDVYDSSLGGDWEEEPEDAREINLEYFLNIEYKYDQSKEPVEFQLNFSSDRIDISKGGWYDPGRWGGTMPDSIEPSGESWFDGFDWGDIEVKMNTVEDIEIEFVAFEKAPPKIQNIFIREYVYDFISDYTNLEIRTPEMKDKIQNVPYC